MQGPRIFIFTALRIEADAIARQFGRRAAKGPAPVHFSYNDHSIELYTIGIRAVRLPQPFGPPPAAIIMAGLAGAFDPRLAIGDVIIDASSTWPPQTLPFARHKFHTAAQIVGSVADKADLFARTGAAAVEMENDSVRQFASQCDAPFLFLRAISDTASQAVDPAVLKFVDPFGSIKPSALLGGLARRPGLIRQLRRLSRDSAIALASLASAVKVILQTAG